MTEASSSPSSCVIVGAGIAGLLAAHELQDAGWRVVVLDKGRGVGGRMATRRFGGAACDHGTQFFTTRGDRFSGLVDGWVEEGAAREWTRGFAGADLNRNEDGHPRYRGSEGMTSIPKHLARGLDVRTGEKVVEINAGEANVGEANGASGWEVRTESGLIEGGDVLLLTAPAPQALVLAETGGFELSAGARGELEGISYSPCLALMAVLDGPTGVPEPGGVQIKGEPLDWIGDNRRKGISEAPALTIHAGPEWSRDHYEADEAEISAALLAFAGERLDTDVSSKVRETSLARWRYSWVTEPYPDPFFVASQEPTLVFAGDAFAQPKVEGAALSGLAAADHLLGREG